MIRKALVTKQLKTVADNIKRIRLERNYTQAYVGEMLHLSQNAYSKLELNYTLITVERLIKISIILEVSLFDLLGGDYAEPEVKSLPLLKKDNTIRYRPTRSAMITPDPVDELFGL